MHRNRKLLTNLVFSDTPNAVKRPPEWVGAVDTMAVVFYRHSLLPGNFYTDFQYLHDCEDHFRNKRPWRQGLKVKYSVLWSELRFSSDLKFTISRWDVFGERPARTPPYDVFFSSPHRFDVRYLDLNSSKQKENESIRAHTLEVLEHELAAVENCALFYTRIFQEIRT